MPHGMHWAEKWGHIVALSPDLVSAACPTLGCRCLMRCQSCAYGTFYSRVSPYAGPCLRFLPPRCHATPRHATPDPAPPLCCPMCRAMPAFAAASVSASHSHVALSTHPTPMWPHLQGHASVCCCLHERPPLGTRYHCLPRRPHPHAALQPGACSC